MKKNIKTAIIVGVVALAIVVGVVKVAYCANKIDPPLCNFYILGK